MWTSSVTEYAQEKTINKLIITQQYPSLALQGEETTLWGWNGQRKIRKTIVNRGARVQ